jgi:hypothetical protein
VQRQKKTISELISGARIDPQIWGSNWCYTYHRRSTKTV